MPVVEDLARTDDRADRERDDRLRGIVHVRSHVARGMLINSGFQLGLVGISALRGVVVAAFLTSYDYGVWGLVAITLWTAVGLKSVFGAGEKYVQQSDEDQELAFQRAFTVELLFAAIVVPIAGLVTVGIVLVTGKSVVLAPALTLLLLLPSAALQFPLATFYRRLDYRRQRALQAVEPLVGAVVMVALAVLGFGYWSFVIGAIIGSWCGAVIALRMSPYRFAPRFHRPTIRRYVGFSAPLAIAGCSQLVMFQVIYLVGAGPLGLAGLGAFTLAGNLLQFTNQADAIITETLYPGVCAIKDRLLLLSEVFVKSNRLSLMWAVPFGVGMSLFGSDLVRFVLGVRWEPAIPILEIIGLVMAVDHVGYNWGAFVKARGNNWPIAFAAVPSVVVVLGVAIPLMYSRGLVGLGYAWAIGEVVTLAVRGIVLRRFFSGVRILRHLLRAFAPTLLAVVPVLVIRAAAGQEQTLLAAIAMLVAYVSLTVVATVALEGPLLREAISHLMRRSAGPFVRVPATGSTHA